jgi:multidrug resistance efflux pump
VNIRPTLHEKLALHEKREQVRVLMPATATIDNSSYEVENWSQSGLQLSGFKQIVKIDDCLPVQLQWRIDGEAYIQINTLIEIVWTAPLRGLFGARFLNLTQCEMQLLQHSIENWQSNPTTMAVMEPPRLHQDILHHTPPQDLGLAELWRTPWLKFPLKTLLAVLLYLGIGGGIAGLALAVVAQSLNKMEIRSAAIARKVEPIVVSGVGVLNAMYVQPGEAVKAKQRLFQVSQPETLDRELKDLNALSRNKIDNADRIQQQILLSQIDQAEAQAGLQRIQSLRQQEAARLASYGGITRSNLNTARSKVQALQVQYQMTQNQLSRMATLFSQGAISQQAFEALKSQSANLRGDLQAAQEELQVAQIANQSVQEGSFYDGKQLVGDLPQLTTDVEDWRQKIQLASQKVAVLQKALNQQEQDVRHLEQQKQALQQLSTNGKSAASNPLSVVYQSPFSGLVLKVMKSEGNTVSQGETVIILQQNSNQDVQINAYLTQDQVDQLTFGTQATVVVPALRQNYQAKVVEIDRTGGFEDPIRGKYQFSGSNEQPALVKLKLVNLKIEDQQQLNTGTPVTLQFIKKKNALMSLFQH